jgi:hypothetical protein
MNFIGTAIAEYIKANIPKLQGFKPGIYTYSAEMLTNIRYHTSDYTKSFIEVEVIGTDITELQKYEYGIAVRIREFHTKNIKFSDFVTACIGIDMIMNWMHGTVINQGFQILNVNNMSGVAPAENPDNSYVCEILYKIGVDSCTIPGAENIGDYY